MDYLLGELYNGVADENGDATVSKGARHRSRGAKSKSRETTDGGGGAGGAGRGAGAKQKAGASSQGGAKQKAGASSQGGAKQKAGASSRGGAKQEVGAGSQGGAKQKGGACSQGGAKQEIGACSQGGAKQKEGGWAKKTGEHGAAGKERGRGGPWRGGHSVDRKGATGGWRRDGGGDRQERNRAKSAGSDGAPKGNGLGYKSLQELLEKEPSDVAITLTSKRALKEVLSETMMRKDMVELFCLVMSKAFKSRSNRGTLTYLAGIIKDSGFFRTVLPHYLVGMGAEANQERRKRYPLQLENILIILSEVLSIFPASSLSAVSLLVIQIQAIIMRLKASGIDIQPQVEERVKELEVLIRHLEQKSWEGTLRSDKETYGLLTNGADNLGEEDLEDFRTIPIYPTLDELHKGERPFLRPNLTSQRYTNTHVYLDTHFRLLREDFVRPLREGIQQLLWNQKDMGRSEHTLRGKQFDDIRVYFDTKLQVPKCTHTGIAYVVQFDTQPLKFVRWENTKRLIFGSLVCLSCDYFDTLLFATVSDRDPKDLSKGLVQISFTEESRAQLATVEKGRSFLMVETTAFFEAYRYVLEGLQEQEENNLPFQRYIVECSQEIAPPAYLREEDTYDLAAVADPEQKSVIRPFHSLNPQAWPKMEDLRLDESQMRAFQLALTNELAIIQGPPGTGKTYVGLKIAQALLTNQGLWRRDGAPMLVVCYTNHALDQFLEGIHRFLKPEMVRKGLLGRLGGWQQSPLSKEPRSRLGIVRVGGRSSSEILKPYNLTELLHSGSFRQLKPYHLGFALREIHEQLEEEEKKIQAQTLKMECCTKGIMREDFLQKYILYKHWTSLHQHLIYDGFEIQGERKSSRMMEWLGVGFLSHQQMEPEYLNPFEEAAQEETMSWPDEGLIEVTEEAAMILAERIIDDNTDFRGGREERKKKKERDMRRAVQELEERMLDMNLGKAEIQPQQNENENEVWQIQREERKRLKNYVKRELQETSTMTETEERFIQDIWTLSMQDRWRLYRLWVARYREELCNKVLQCEQDYQNAADRLTEVKRHQSLCVLREATVIGMTTTGAAKYRKLLQEVRPRLVIVEEAAEVLEAHTITTLSEACQHLILIGDHQQLRPSATVYELAKNFHLEMSMFERLVNMGLPYVRLNYQHRMRPDIARLLTPHIYSELENHPSVLEYENIKGLKTNLFFLEHNHLEEDIKDGKSHKNKHEAKFVVALCRYFLLQDYKPEQITILTTYTGQLQCLRSLMPVNQFQGVKVHVVDKYQGEENDIVILSLVRSNPQGKVGFLNIPNRVCVALSRAKKGLYCIGNSGMLGQVKLWSNIFSTLKEQSQIGKALTLCCQNHPDRLVTASCAEDFQQAPEGGCTQPCEFRLKCGHVCTRVCHPYDPEHKKFMCMKKCAKTLCELEHKCPLLCHQKCPKNCTVKVEKIIPKCQHKQMVPCHQDPATFMCKMPCQKLLDCGHPCDSYCGSECSKCMVVVNLHLRCGHITQDACFYKTELVGPECKAPCEHQLKCGHACRGTCSICYAGRFHRACSQPCERVLICSHKCEEPCTRDCPPCRKPCENCCIHSKCKKRCGESCAPCNEPCAWQCPHQSCTKLCHEPCDRPPCTKPCNKTLGCGHPCIGLCGDKCPSKCRICNHEEVTEIFFGTEDDPEASFIQLEDCGHIIEFTAMDTYMGVNNNQQTEEGEEVVIKLKECPKCRTPIRKNLRYGSRINSSLAEIEKVKAKMNGDQAEVRKHWKALRMKWKVILPTCSVLEKECLPITECLRKSDLTANDLWILENKMEFLQRIAKLKEIRMEKLSFLQSFILEKKVGEFLGWLNNRRQKFTEQQVFDLQRELQRLTLLTELLIHCDTAKERGLHDKIKTEVEAMRRVLEKMGQFTKQDEERVREGKKELNKKVPLTGLMISEEDRKMIVSAMKMRQGHWYKCPNGHVYVITECGGAMERRKCPDCDAVIGGASHRLESGNQVATEMDGAQHAAWSEQNNLLNFGEFNN
ncbi:NFX1-type zinc finger-containing protein 1 isoform X2 [Cheilinus undulatus]|uniref:NFX1-type zinc finger-containing protein 1 isoform X2 n=1 Tax=Cheilinus undulatus TaxID=241271 RepID=UPI001BD1D1BF|nr:NFX1-type zinc finger-containing protein 1 isoform X2 [Cheilinus undulatus]